MPSTITVGKIRGRGQLCLYYNLVSQLSHPAPSTHTHHTRPPVWHADIESVDSVATGMVDDLLHGRDQDFASFQTKPLLARPFQLQEVFKPGNTRTHTWSVDKGGCGWWVWLTWMI